MKWDASLRRNAEGYIERVHPDDGSLYLRSAISEIDRLTALLSPQEVMTLERACVTLNRNKHLGFTTWHDTVDGIARIPQSTTWLSGYGAIAIANQLLRDAAVKPVAEPAKVDGLAERVNRMEQRLAIIEEVVYQVDALKRRQAELTTWLNNTDKVLDKIRDALSED